MVSIEGQWLFHENCSYSANYDKRILSYIFISLFHLHGHWHEKLTLYVSKRLFIFKGLAFLQFFFSILMKCVKSVIIEQTTNLFTLQTLLLCPNFNISTANLSFQILDLKYQFYGFLHLLSQEHNTRYMHKYNIVVFTSYFLQHQRRLYVFMFIQFVNKDLSKCLRLS